jgi:hypothetical protein
VSLKKQAALVEKLIERSEADLIDWKPTVDDSAFQVSFKNYTIRLSSKYRRDESGDYVTDYIVELLNEEGAVADRFSDTDLMQDAELRERATWWKDMGRLFEKARRSALGADKALDSVLQELDDIIPF